MGYKRLGISVPDMKLHKAFLPVIQKNQNFLKNISVVAVRNLKFAKAIVDRYYGTYFYDFDFSAFVFLDNFQKAEAQEEKHRKETETVYRALNIWHVYEQHMHLSNWYMTTLLYQRELSVLQNFGTVCPAFIDQRAGLENRDRKQSRGAAVYIISEQFRQTTQHLRTGNRILPVRERLTRDFKRQEFFYEYIQEAYQQMRASGYMAVTGALPVSEREMPGNKVFVNEVPENKTSGNKVFVGEVPENKASGNKVFVSEVPENKASGNEMSGSKISGNEAPEALPYSQIRKEILAFFEKTGNEMAETQRAETGKRENIFTAYDAGIGQRVALWRQIYKDLPVIQAYLTDGSGTLNPGQGDLVNPEQLSGFMWGLDQLIEEKQIFIELNKQFNTELDKHNFKNSEEEKLCFIGVIKKYQKNEMIRKANEQESMDMSFPGEVSGKETFYEIENRRLENLIYKISRYSGEEWTAFKEKIKRLEIYLRQLRELKTNLQNLSAISEKNVIDEERISGEKPIFSEKLAAGEKYIPDDRRRSGEKTISMKDIRTAVRMNDGGKLRTWVQGYEEMTDRHCHVLKAVEKYEEYKEQYGFTDFQSEKNFLVRCLEECRIQAQRLFSDEKSLQQLQMVMESSEGRQLFQILNTVRLTQSQAQFECLSERMIEKLRHCDQLQWNELLAKIHKIYPAVINVRNTENTVNTLNTVNDVNTVNTLNTVNAEKSENTGSGENSSAGRKTENTAAGKADSQLLHSIIALQMTVTDLQKIVQKTEIRELAEELAEMKEAKKVFEEIQDIFDGFTSESENVTFSGSYTARHLQTMADVVASVGQHLRTKKKDIHETGFNSTRRQLLLVQITEFLNRLQEVVKETAVHLLKNTVHKSVRFSGTLMRELLEDIDETIENTAQITLSNISRNQFVSEMYQIEVCRERLAQFYHEMLSEQTAAFYEKREKLLKESESKNISEIEEIPETEIAEAEKKLATGRALKTEKITEAAVATAAEKITEAVVTSAAEKITEAAVVTAAEKITEAAVTSAAEKVSVSEDAREIKETVLQAQQNFILKLEQFRRQYEVSLFENSFERIKSLVRENEVTQKFREVSGIQLSPLEAAVMTVFTEKGFRQLKHFDSTQWQQFTEALEMLYSDTQRLVRERTQLEKISAVMALPGKMMDLENAPVSQRTFDTVYADTENRENFYKIEYFLQSYVRFLEAESRQTENIQSYLHWSAQNAFINQAEERNVLMQIFESYSVYEAYEAARKQYRETEKYFHDQPEWQWLIRQTQAAQIFEEESRIYDESGIFAHVHRINSLDENQWRHLKKVLSEKYSEVRDVQLNTVLRETVSVLKLERNVRELNSLMIHSLKSSIRDENWQSTVNQIAKNGITRNVAQDMVQNMVQNIMTPVSSYIYWYTRRSDTGSLVEGRKLQQTAAAVPEQGKKTGDLPEIPWFGKIFQNTETIDRIQQSSGGMLSAFYVMHFREKAGTAKTGNIHLPGWMQNQKNGSIRAEDESAYEAGHNADYITERQTEYRADNITERQTEHRADYMTERQTEHRADNITERQTEHRADYRTESRTEYRSVRTADDRAESQTEYRMKYITDSQTEHRIENRTEHRAENKTETVMALKKDILRQEKQRRDMEKLSRKVSEQEQQMETLTREQKNLKKLLQSQSGELEEYRSEGGQQEQQMMLQLKKELRMERIRRGME